MAIAHLKRDFVATLESRLFEKAPLIQVVLGPRQVGKTTGVGMVRWGKEKVHYCSADEALSLGADWISEQWQIARALSENSILVIDEVQKILHWSERIKALWDSEKRARRNFRLVLLGSSSLSLSMGLDESLAGRFEIIPAPHWSFAECEIQFKVTLEDYLIFGGYPEAFRFNKDFSRWKSYLGSSIIEAIISKDILRFAVVKKPALFRQCFELASSYPAQEVSYHKLLGQLQEGGNIDLVKHYFTLFEGAYLFKFIHRYSGSKVRVKSSSPKILPLCPALASYHFTQAELESSEIKGRLFEAAVGAAFHRSGCELYYWREKQYEVDFIVKDGKRIFAVEVKSGRKRTSSRSMEILRKNLPNAMPVFLQWEHYAAFEKNPIAFLSSIAG